MHRAEAEPPARGTTDTETTRAGPEGQRGCRGPFLRAGFTDVQGFHVSDVTIRLTFE